MIVEFAEKGIKDFRRNLWEISRLVVNVSFKFSASISVMGEFLAFAFEVQKVFTEHPLKIEDMSQEDGCEKAWRLYMRTLYEDI